MMLTTRAQLSEPFSPQFFSLKNLYFSPPSTLLPLTNLTTKISLKKQVHNNSSHQDKTMK